jgi:hypothetical protein
MQTVLSILTCLAIIAGIVFWVRGLSNPTELVKATVFIGTGFLLSVLTGDAKFMIIPGALLFGTLLHAFYGHQPPEI